MAAFTGANLLTVLTKIGYGVDNLITALATAETRKAARLAAYQAITDDEGLGAKLAAANSFAIDSPKVVDIASVRSEIMTLVAECQGASAPTTDDAALATSLAELLTARVPAWTNALVNYPAVLAIRAATTDDAVPADVASIPAAVSFGTEETTGATAGTFTAPGTEPSTTYPTTAYAGALIEAYVTAVPGVTTGTAVYALVGLDMDGKAWGGTLTLPNNTALYGTVEIVPAVAKTYPAQITAVTVTSGGANGMNFTLRSKTPQTLA